MDNAVSVHLYFKCTYLNGDKKTERCLLANDLQNSGSI